MPARLIIRSNDSEDVRWIESPVMRVGSGPDSDVNIDNAGVADHAFTLEFREGQYVLHNRSNAAIHVGSRVVNPGSSLPIKAGQLVQIDEDIQIALDFDGDPSPGAAPRISPIRFSSAQEQSNKGAELSDDVHADDDLVEVSATQRKTVGFDGKVIVQLGIIIICFVAGAGILLLKNRSEVPSMANGFKDLNELVQAAQSTRSDWPIGIAKEIQLAERDLLRGQDRAACSRFCQVRDAIFSPPRNAEKEFVSKTREFVTHRISEMGVEQ